MNVSRVALSICLLLTACSQDPAGVRVINESVALASGAPAIRVKTEPVFYNGKTYQVSVSPAAGGGANIGISGMAASQAKDASGLATSAFHHFSCKDSQKAVLQNSPVFDGTSWKVAARCA